MIQAFTIILLGLTIVLSTYTNQLQTEMITVLRDDVQCHKNGLVYIGDHFCYDPNHEAFKDAN